MNLAKYLILWFFIRSSTRIIPKATKGIVVMNMYGHKTLPVNDNKRYGTYIEKIPAPKKKLKGKVVDVIEKGYFLNGKVIRHAKIVVGS